MLLKQCGQYLEETGREMMGRENRKDGVGQVARPQGNEISLCCTS